MIPLTRMSKGGRTNFTSILLAALLVTMVFAVFALPARAGEGEKRLKAKELTRLRQQISSLRHELVKTKSLHDSVRAELRRLEREISNRVRALKIIKYQLHQSTRKLISLKKIGRAHV